MKKTKKEENTAEKTEKPSLKRSLSNMVFLLKPWYRYARLMVFIDCFTRFICYPIRTLAAATIVQAIIAAAESGRGSIHVLAVAASYLGVIFICWAAKETRDALYLSWKSPQVMAYINREIYAQSMKTDYKYIDSPEYFDSYKQAVEKYAPTSQTTYDLVINGVASLASLATSMVVIALKEPLVILIAGLCMFLGAYLRSRNNIIVNKVWVETTPQERRLGYLTRLLYTKAANADLRTTNAPKFVLGGYNDTVAEQVRKIKKYNVPRLVYNLLSRLTDDLGTSLVAIYLALGLVAGRIDSIGEFTTLILLAGQMNNELWGISYSITDLMSQSLYAEKIRKFFELKSGIEPDESGREAPGGSFDLELRDVSFKYPNSDFALRDISLKIPAGSKIAIVGENGAGKTTLSKLLLRLYDINSGELLINGVSINNYNNLSLRRRIGVAFQEPQIYAQSIRANMQGYHEADDETLISVLRIVGLDAESFTNNGKRSALDAEVTREFDDTGVMLSGGQSQKLGLSRLMHGDFGLLLLDEPSSALDPLAEYELTKLLFNKADKTTTIMVAHRLSTIRDADMIYLISEGIIAEQGTHDELMAKNGKYTEMFTKQAEKYRE